MDCCDFVYDADDAILLRSTVVVLHYDRSTPEQGVWDGFVFVVENNHTTVVSRGDGHNSVVQYVIKYSTYRSNFGTYVLLQYYFRVRSSTTEYDTV
jgi:hypothetical protein